MTEDMDSNRIYLYPGSLYIGESPALVTTVLGSCVSLTLYHPRLKVGAICHGVLPKCDSIDVCKLDCVECFKYVNSSITYMFDEFNNRGIRSVDLEAKLFGGADLLRSTTSSKIGTANVMSALEMITKAKVSVRAADVGDHFGRKIVFNTSTGEVLLKRLDKAVREETESVTPSQHQEPITRMSE